MDQAASLEQRAIDLARRGDFGQDARTVNEELTRVAPDNQGAWTRLARCCLELGFLDDATGALDAALRLNPQNTIARNLQAEVSRRRAGALAPLTAARKRTSSTPRTRTPRESSATSPRSSKATTLAMNGIGRAEFAALGHLPSQSAAEALTARLEPLLMALNDRPFAARVTEARNRAGHSGVRLFRRGSIEPGSPGHIHVYQQGGRWEPQVNIGLFSSQQWTRDALAAGIAFELAPGNGDDRAQAGRERLFEYFEGFQQIVASAWRVHLTDWLRTSGGFVQIGDRPPSTDLLPGDAVSALVNVANPGELGWVSFGRWLFMDRGEDIGILTDASRLVRWLEQTFNDLLPLWGEVYRGAYRSSRGNSQGTTGGLPT